MFPLIPSVIPFDPTPYIDPSHTTPYVYNPPADPSEIVVTPNNPPPPEYRGPNAPSGSLKDIPITDIIIDTSTTIGLAYLINAILKDTFEDLYVEVASIGLSAGVISTILSPIISNVRKEKNFNDNLKFDQTMGKNFLINGALTSAIYLALITAFPDLKSSSIKKYSIVACSVIVASLLSRVINKPKPPDKLMYN